MPRIHGKNGLIYLGGAGVASPLSQAADYDIAGDFDLDSVAVLGDTFDSFVKGLQKWSGTLNGPFDTGQTTIFDAWGAQSPSPLYLYPNKASLAQYYYGYCWPKVNVKGSTTNAVTFSAGLTGDGPLSRN